MHRVLAIAAAMFVLATAGSSFAIDLPVEIRLDRASVKSFAKDASAATVTFRLYSDETCSSTLFGTASTSLAQLDVARVKNEKLKNDPTPAAKEEWVLGSEVPVPDLSDDLFSFAPVGNVFATATVQGDGAPVVSSCQRQKYVHVQSECGDDVAVLNEECDGTDLRGQTCQTLLSTVGTLECTSECELDTSGCGSCPGTGGVVVGGTCWYLADPSQSCTDACAAQTLEYSSMTLTYAGSGGTTAQCFAVLDALGYTSPPALSVGDYSSSQPVGCLYDPSDPGFRVRITDPAPTTADAVDGRRRVCACE
jgi:hypothetical protein